MFALFIPLSVCLVARLQPLKARFQASTVISAFCNMSGYHFSNQFSLPKAILGEAPNPSFSKSILRLLLVGS